LAGLEDLPLITRIYASKNEITELDSLKSFPEVGNIAISNNHVSVLPEELKTKLPKLAYINASNQTITLPEQTVASNLVLDNSIKNFGQVATANSISDKGTYKDNQITWTAANLKDVNTVDYGFSESVSQSPIDGTFSGKVTVPLKKVNLPVITARDEIYYEKNANITEKVFLSNVAASATEGATITTDYNTVVDFTKGGTYEVTLNAKNSAGFEAEPVKVKVHINKALAPVITANTEISYMVFAEVTEADFLKNIQASTNDGSIITSDFGTGVKWNEAGDYTVTLKSVNSDDVDAKPVQVTVRITPNPTPILANVVFDIDDVQTTEAIVVEGFITEPAAPTKDGYTFDGWYDAKTGGNKWNFATNKMPATGITLYAQFSKIVNNDPQTGGGTTTVTENNNGVLSDPPANTNNKAKDANKKSQTDKHPATGDSQNMLYLLAGLLLVGVSLRIFKKTYSK
ncbi:TPA: LapB repeat-containing protein, partial [Listeria monocytogenes]|nr:LapB repeat-containing protein [Listeria monocytogenes]